MGATIDDHQEFESHISEKINIANKMFGLLQRSFNCLDTKTFTCLYKTMVRAHVIFSGSFSTLTNNHMINVFTLVRASQNESPNSRYPRNPYYS